MTDHQPALKALLYMLVDSPEDAKTELRRLTQPELNRLTDALDNLLSAADAEAIRRVEKR